LRALENFNITGIPIAHYPQLIHSLAHIKKAAALANHDLGLLPRHIADVIARACDDIIAGKHHDRIFTVAAQRQILKELTQNGPATRRAIGFSKLFILHDAKPVFRLWRATFCRPLSASC